MTPAGALLDELTTLPDEEVVAVLEGTTEEELRDLLYGWDGIRARESQVPPAWDWRVWLVLAGRGFGKTRTGGELVRRWVRDYPMVNLIGATADDVRQIMVEGESGLLNICAPWERPEYKPAARTLFWPNGAKSLLFTADEPERLRGKQHMKLWCLIAGTLVRMADGGECAIEQVPVGALVQTSAGPRRVSAKGVRMAPLVRVTFANGTSLCGSPDHPIATPDGWRPLGRLPLSARIYLWSDDGGRAWSGISTPTRASANSIGTEWFGKRRTGQFLPAARSTTGTALRETTGSTIWNCSLRQRTEKRIPRDWSRRLASVAASSSSTREWDTLRAIAARAAALPAKPSDASSSADAAIVGRPSPRTGATTVVSGVSILARVGRVFNLTVEAPSDYYANGILTHNCDECASWRYAEAWDQAMFGLRLGNNPQAVVTTTPRPIPLIRTLMDASTTAITRGSTYENRANLAPAYYADIIKRYEGTRLGRQELLAEILTDNPGALWKREELDAHRVATMPDLVRIVVGVDPEATSTDEGAQTGIIVAAKGADGHGYVLDDRSVRTTPHGWATAAVAAYHTHHANLLVAETNQGGDMVQHTIRSVDAAIPYKGVHASRSKQARAEPVAALYEQGRIHHVGAFGPLEDQLCEWVPGSGPSPDRLDALVWAFTELLVQESAPVYFA